MTMTRNAGKTIRISLETLLEELTDLLEREGFIVSGVTDLQRDFLEKLNAHYGKYKILTIHHPHFFRQMLSIAPVGGLVLPCSITLMENYPGDVEVFVFNPAIFLAKEVRNVSLLGKAEEVSRKLNEVIHQLERVSDSIPDLITSWE